MTKPYLAVAFILILVGNFGLGRGASADDPDCHPGLVLCGDQCVDSNSNDDYCGDCVTSCAVGETCVDAGCVTGVAELILSEVSAQEPIYFELYNGYTSSIDLQNYLIQWQTDSFGSGTGSVALPAYTLASEEFVVLIEGSGTSGNGVIYLGDGIAWTSGIGVRLISPGGVGLDFVRIGTSTTAPPTGTTWLGDNAPNPLATGDQSLVRNLYTADTESAADWAPVAEESPGSYCPVPDRCGDTCYDFTSHPDNCGGCGRVCSSTELCVDGVCTSTLASVPSMGPAGIAALSVLLLGLAALALRPLTRR